MKTQKSTTAFVSTSVSDKSTRNEIGSAFWEFRLDDAACGNDVDTQRSLRILNSDILQLDNTNFASDPYNTSVSKPAADKPRRSLDDLRKLSEEIVNARAKLSR